MMKQVSTVMFPWDILHVALTEVVTDKDKSGGKVGLQKSKFSYWRSE